LLNNLISFAGDFARGKAGLTSPYLANPQQSLRGIWRSPHRGDEIKSADIAITRQGISCA
jgi:hypothetical protein